MSKLFLTKAQAFRKLGIAGEGDDWIQKWELMATGKCDEGLLAAYGEYDFVADDDVVRQITVPRPIFCIDFSDMRNNANSIYDSINGYVLYPGSATNTVNIVMKDGLRCMGVGSSSTNNVFSIAWSSIKGVLENVLKTGNFTCVEFYACPTTTSRWGLSAFYNSCQMCNWDTSNGRTYIAMSSPAIFISHLAFDGGTKNNLGMRFYGVDRSKRLLIASGLVSESNAHTTDPVNYFAMNTVAYTGEGSISSISSTTSFVVGRSQESSYCMVAGTYLAKMAFYSELLSEDQLRQIYDSKELIF